MRSALAFALAAVVGCGPSAKGRPAAPTKSSVPPGLEVHAASGRPRLVIVRREGDPSAAIAIELRGGDGDAFRLAVVAAIVAARLEREGFQGVEVVAGERTARVRALVPELSADLATKLDALLARSVMTDPLAIGAARKAIEAFAARPVGDPALARATRCLDRATRPAKWKAPPVEEAPSIAEALRDAQVRSDLVVVSAVGSGATDALVARWRSLPVLAGSTTFVGQPEPPPAAALTLSQTHEGAIVVVEGGPRAALPTALESLSAADGPLASRLRAAEGWRLSAVAGAARPEGACVVVEVEPAQKTPSKDWSVERLATRASVALEVARQEVELALEAARGEDDGEAAKRAIGSGGDPREAADRAAWWAWPRSSVAALASFATLEVPATAIAKAPSADVEESIATATPKFALALNRAKLAWTKSELELRSRVEAGQGELWAALATPCGPAHEGALDAGLASAAARALVAAHATRISDGVVVEPWGASTGIGIVAHAAPRTGESASGLAQRVGDAVGRLFLASFPEPPHVASARNDVLVALTSHASAADLVRASLGASAPLHPSWLSPDGSFESVAKVGVDAVDLRLATLRAGPLRFAVIANEGEAQVEVAARAAERWVPRRPGETRACPIVDPGAPPKGGIHPLTVKAGTGVAIAFPVDEPERPGATLLAAMLDGAAGALATEVAGGVATSWGARVIRGVGRSALVVYALAPDPNVDAVVARLRVLLDRLRTGGATEEDLARGRRAHEEADVVRKLDPRGRLVDLFAGELEAKSIDLAQLRAAAAKVLVEEKAQLVVARLGT